MARSELRSELLTVENMNLRCCSMQAGLPPNEMTSAVPQIPLVTKPAYLEL